MTRDAQDDALVECARRGDAESFALLYHRYKTDVWNMALFTLRDHHEAEDTLQDTFLKAYRALGQYRRSDSLRPWLLTICRNVCMDRLRSRPRRLTVSLDDEDVAEPAVRAEDHDQRIDFHQALVSLPLEDREAFFLVDVLGCHSDEAARICGLRASSTLRSRLAKARRHLAPAVSDVPAGRQAEVWGLYHSPPDSAIVVCFAATARGDAARQGVRDLLARLHAHNGPVTALPYGPGWDLVAFLERLDRVIPAGREVMAVVESGRNAGDASTARWLASHPRWKLNRVRSHATWLNEVQRLIDGQGAELASLETDKPFLWTLSA